MTIKQVMETLDAELLTPEADLTREVHAACGSDMMSDVLAYVKDQAVLVTQFARNPGWKAPACRPYSSL